MKEAEWREKANLPQVTLRATVAGIAIGTIVLVSNFQFGLQTGWISMMSLPSALLGFAIFKLISTRTRLVPAFSDVENVYVQSLSVAVGSGPLAFGFVGVIPAIEKFLTPEEAGMAPDSPPICFPVWQLILWCCGLAFFGVFFAIPLRKEVIIKEKLPFPSGSATATMISVLHNTEILEEEDCFADRKVGIHKFPDGDDEEEGTVIGLDGHLDGEMGRGRDLRGGFGSGNENRMEYSEAGIPDVSAPNSTPNSAPNSASPLTILDTITPHTVYASNIRNLLTSFSVSAAFAVVAYFLPLLRRLPILGPHLAAQYLWTFQPSPAYFGQGIIMGLPTVSYMLVGCIIGWGVLAPLARNAGWADGPVDDWKTGAQGWVLWVSLALMVVDSVLSFAVVSAESVAKVAKMANVAQLWQRRGSGRRSSPELGSEPQEESREPAEEPLLASRSDSRSDSRSNSAENPDIRDFVAAVCRSSDSASNSDVSATSISTSTGNSSGADLPARHQISLTTALFGVLASSVLCAATVRAIFGATVPLYAVIAAICLALVFAILSVRALGETDLNPVSGISKLSQLLFALIVPASVPGSVLINLLAGGISEAGAMQSSDLMQDLKTGHLVGAAPRAQFYAQIVGAVYSAVATAVMYRVYDSVYQIPSREFPVPTAVVWVDCARLVTGSGLPEHVTPFVFGAGLAAGLLAGLKWGLRGRKAAVWIPSGVAMGIGMYNAPSFTLARFAGGAAGHIWLKWRQNGSGAVPHDKKVALIICASGLVLGEGLMSVVTMLFTSLGVPHW